MAHLPLGKGWSSADPSLLRVTGVGDGTVQGLCLHQASWLCTSGHFHKSVSSPVRRKLRLDVLEDPLELSGSLSLVGTRLSFGSLGGRRADPPWAPPLVPQSEGQEEGRGRCQDLRRERRLGVGKRVAKGRGPAALPPPPPTPRRCCGKTNATTSWTGDSGQPGRGARDHPGPGAGGPGPLRYLQSARSELRPLPQRHRLQ